MNEAAIWSFWGPLLTIALVFAIRLRRAGRERLFDLRRWWLLPLFFTALVGILLAAAPPPLLGWATFVAALVPGALLGWHRGKLTDLHLDEQGRVVQRTSPLAILMLLAIVLVRSGVRQYWGGAPGDPHPALLATLVTDGLLGLALGLVVATRIELLIRARRLIGAAPA